MSSLSPQSWLVICVPVMVCAGCSTDQLLAEVLHDGVPSAGGLADAREAGSTLGNPLTVRCSPCNDFPPDPIVDISSGSIVPPEAAQWFANEAGVGSLPGPCLIEPESGSLLPKNWIRPRFHLNPVADQKLFEIRLHADIEKNDLVVYTSATIWTLPREIWTGLAEHAIDQPITISVRGLDPKAASPRPSLPSYGSMTIAPAPALGNIVYWSESQVSLKGFAIGDESVGMILRPAQVRGTCLGCHSSTPDGQFMAVSVSVDRHTGVPAHIELRTLDGQALERAATPSVMSLLARADQYFPLFSRAHWSMGEHLMITIYQRGLMWTDLDARSADRGVAWDMLSLVNDPNQYATHPTWSHDGATIAYSSLAQPGPNPALGTGTDLYVVPFNARRGGAATPIPGASLPHINECYPSFSSDDKLIAFTRSLGPYDATSPDLLGTPADIESNPLAEIFVIPPIGGAPQRLAANDPPSCSGAKSPGITNSWPTWSPQAATIGAKTYYWLTFSSKRNHQDTPQLFVSGLVIDSSGQIHSYPALYLWNQPENEHNHHPVWDAFELPYPPIN